MFLMIMYRQMITKSASINYNAVRINFLGQLRMVYETSKGTRFRQSINEVIRDFAIRKEECMNVLTWKCLTVGEYTRYKLTQKSKLLGTVVAVDCQGNRSVCKTVHACVELSQSPCYK